MAYRRLIWARIGTPIAIGIAFTSVARGQPAPNDSVQHRAGESSRAEAAVQLGTLSGVRLDALLRNSGRYTLGVEGLYGISTFAGEGVLHNFAPTYGLGPRMEIQVAGDHRDATFIAPALVTYYIPAFGPRAPDSFPAGNIGYAIVGYGIGTPVFAASSNVDIGLLHQFYEHFGLIAGIRLGVAITLNGRTNLGDSIAGTVRPDLDFFVGVRI
jgi:hypothetical protein